MLKGWEEKKEQCSVLPGKEAYLFVFTLLICVWGEDGERERLRGETHAHAYIYIYIVTCPHASVGT